MEQKTKRGRFPGAGWLSAHLSRKMLLALIALAVLSWAVMCGCFLAYLGRYAGNTYDQVLSDAQEDARQAAAFLEGCDGDFQALERYLSERDLYGTVRGGGEELLYARLPEESQAGLVAASAVEVELTGGRRVELLLWVRAMQRNELSRSLQREALIGLAAFNVCVFLVVAVIMYLVLVDPIVRLRKTMRCYSERGERPERSERQDEVGKLQNAFADLAGVLECKEKAEHQLIASISHDIKTPLTSVLGYSERLHSADLPPEKQRQYLDRVYEKALRIKSVVDEFDDYLDVGLRDTAPMRLMTAEELCRRLREEYEAELSDAGVTFQVDCRCPREQVICNWEHMRRFFGNLIGNSFQHAESDHLELRLQCQKEEEELVLLFQDNGRGVAPALLQQIFEPLYTSDPGRKVSGLGLSICKSIIRAHGGSISAENVPTGGLLIRASLPCVKF